MEPLTVRPSEAARALGISRTVLYGLLADGSIESIKVGASRLIPLESLRRFVDERRARAEGGAPEPAA